MEQNNFEKNMQQKLDELKIPPSDSAWANVEKRIGKKDKDKKLIFILFFLILFLLSGGYWLLNSSKNKEQQKNQLSEVKNESKPTNKDNFSFKKTESVNHDSANTPDSANSPEEKIKTVSIKSRNKTSVRNQKSSGSKTESREREQVIFLSKNDNQRKQNENKLNIQSNSKPTDGNEVVIDKENITKKDSVLDKKEITKNSSENKVQTIAKKESNKSIEKKKNHWDVGITLSGGTSMINKNSSFRNSAFFVSDPGSYNTGGIPSYYYSPSQINNSIGFIAGIFVEKNIASKKKISIGISYKYFSFINKVGNRIDSLYSLPQAFSSLNNVYSSAVNLKTYRNNFHFIELPISIKFQLNNNSSLPISWDAGINISQLISSNALQFNSGAGLYYSDNSLFNKTQFGLSSGFSVTIFAKGKRPFNLEPYFYYSATILSSKGVYNKKHFTFVGLRTEILFGKK
ncbi:MAG: outer membrane beta-barrel protein [Ginsengibacter sp.]